MAAAVIATTNSIVKTRFMFLLPLDSTGGRQPKPCQTHLSPVLAYGTNGLSNAWPARAFGPPGLLLFGEQQLSKRDRQRCQRLLNERQLAPCVALRQENGLTRPLANRTGVKVGRGFGGHAVVAMRGA